MRSALFNALFYAWTTVTAVICTPLAYVPSRKPLLFVFRIYAQGVMVLMRLVAGIKVEIQGRENIPEQGPSLIAAKHQSYCDGLVVLSVIPDLATVAMKKLASYPLLGRLLKRAEMILVDNCGGPEARSALSKRAQKAYEDGRPILIYPEGHLAPVGESFRYRHGIYHLYKDFNLPVVPVATNIGLRWQCENWIKKPGRAVVEFLAPIPVGHDKDAFMATLEQRIETRTAQLVEAYQ